MSGPNHALGGIVFTGIYLSMWDKNIFGHPLYLAATVFFSLLADVDHTKSIAGKLFYPLAKWLDRRFGHRTITHSLLCYFVLSFVVGLLEKIWSSGTIYTMIFLWAYGSHLIFDMLTLQGVPLFYPFKKNPCVIPGNPAFRFRSSNFRTESLIFLTFIFLAFTLKGLFANGFWNSYNKVFSNIRHVEAEMKISDNVVKVLYDVEKLGKRLKGEGLAIAATDEKLFLFTGTGFLELDKQRDRVIETVPVRTSKKLLQQELSFTGISFDSLQRLIAGKPVLSLKLQTALPISYTKDNAPQSGTSVDLQNVYNPVLGSSDIDSLDVATQKEIELVKLQLERSEAEQRQFAVQKGKAWEKLHEAEKGLNSPEMAVKERAVKDLPAAKAAWEALRPPIDDSRPLRLQLEFLKRKLHITKKQSINGFLSYIQVH